MKRRFTGTTMLLVVLAAGPASAQDPAAIRSRTEELMKAMTAGDAEAVAAFWTTGGEYARGDVSISGREAIHKAYTEHFKTKPAGTLTVEGDTVRFLSDGLAVQEGTFSVQRDNPANGVRTRFSTLYVKGEDGWQIGLLREHADGPSLGELAWLVGDWTFKVGDTDATMSVQPTKRKTFIRVETKVGSGDNETTAIQVIGIDPTTGGMKSWSFESDGGIGTAEWVRTETGWLANVSATSAAGEKVQAVTTITPSGKDEFTFQTTERTVDGEKAPEVAAVKVTRSAAGR